MLTVGSIRENNLHNKQTSAPCFIVMVNFTSWEVFNKVFNCEKLSQSLYNAGQFYSLAMFFFNVVVLMQIALCLLHGMILL